MRILQTVSVLGVCLSAGLTGCYKSIHYVPQTMAPTVFRTATVDVLQKEVSDRDAAIKTLNAAVDITATTGGGKEGKVVTYTSLHGYIFMRKPGDLRVLMQKPVIGSRAVDMVSDGKSFTLLINGLTGSRAIVGSNTVTKPSKNGLENLRPAVFFDSLLVPGVGADEWVSVTESTRVVQTNQGRKREAIEEPDYDITISRHQDGNVLQTTRVVHINRINMLPFQQDIYDEHGRVVTSAIYEHYEPYGALQFPSRITIKRPLDEYSLKIDVTKLTLNGPLENDQFELKIPPGIPIQKMDEELALPRP
jgi:outer membrane lipoprotein-sorting protein